MNVEEPTVRRPVNVSLDPTLVREARELGVNLSRACETGLSRTIAEHRERTWLAENGAALASSNAWVEAHGLPLDSLRQF